MGSNFSWAFNMLKSGRKVRRNIWGADSYVIIGSFSPAVWDDNGQKFLFGDYLYKCEARPDSVGIISPYTPSQEDLFATDWECILEKK